jgi:hypothetical protein
MARPKKIVRRLLLAVLSAAALGAVAAVAAMAVLGYGPAEAWQAFNERSPVEMIGYAKRRLEGHPALEALLGPPLGWLNSRFVREPSGFSLDLGKGVQPGGLTAQRYDENGAPRPALPAASEVRSQMPTRMLSDAEAIEAAVRSAEPGDVLEIEPGTYALPGTLQTRNGGSPDAPITLRAARPGTVTLEVRRVEGIVVSQPYWIFENLEWVGRCDVDDNCEHAFHIVGDARGTVVRNQKLVDFSAHLKINGQDGRFPDDGLLQFSTLIDTRPRVGGAPVSFVDLVAASGWQLMDNHVENFVKQGSDGVSYGMFMKGGGEHGRIERNLVVCTPTNVSQPGLRVGLSMGGGTTDPIACRDQRCDVEFEDAVVANNVVAHCNDAGIDVNKSRGIEIVHNTLINTQGIMIRNSPAEARVLNNLMDSRIRQRRGTTLSANLANSTGDLVSYLVAPDVLDLRWRKVPELLDTPEGIATDFCGRRRAVLSEPGAGVACPGADGK